MAKHIKSADADSAVVGRSLLDRVVLINNRFAVTAWRTGEQRARK